jgi:hypothetical protein
MFDITLHPLPGINEVGADVMVGGHCLRSLNMHMTYTVVQKLLINSVVLSSFLFSSGWDFLFFMVGDDYWFSWSDPKY